MTKAPVMLPDILLGERKCDYQLRKIDWRDPNRGVVMLSSKIEFERIGFDL